ncbi:MAG: (deoxy)nucleoside triphosphate pyrophosphohydrolase [Desulfuromonadaceae bacterium]|nr:(deoxy)nucleoside triphosphate pyrophosphohydrolase [Desulfuromonadaceae bacterium]
MLEVAAAIIVEDGLVLLGQRSEHTHLGGYWEFPGGKLEPGESVYACVEREVQEELGVAARAGALVCESIYAYPFGTVKLLCVHTFLLQKQLMRNVHTRLEWVALEALSTYNLAPADIPVVPHLLRYFAPSTTPGLPLG